MLLVTVAGGARERTGCSAGANGSCTGALWETFKHYPFLLTRLTFASCSCSFHDVSGALSELSLRRFAQAAGGSKA